MRPVYKRVVTHPEALLEWLLPMICLVVNEDA